MFLLDKLKAYRLILGSRSPRRRALMTDCDLEFTPGMDYDVEECYPESLPLDKVSEYLSRLKSEHYPVPLEPDQILITADTTVLCRERILHKPSDQIQACQMLRTLSGGTHQVITGVTLRSASRIETFNCMTTVYFKKLSRQEIKYYVEKYRPYDKAGAYGIQEWIGCVGIERIDGSFYNVMGLPVQRLWCTLERFIES